MVPRPPPKLVPSDLEQLLQQLLGGGGGGGGEQRPKPAAPVKTGLRWCGKPRHGATRCPALNVTFPFMLPGWKAEKVERGYAMISLCVAAAGQRLGSGWAAAGQRLGSGWAAAGQRLGSGWAAAGQRLGSGWAENGD